jgi:hypothetical protein
MTNAHTRLSSARTVATFARHGTCSETLFNVVDRAFGHPLPIEEHASAPLAGGIMAHGHQCGQVWGASLAAGAEAYRQLGAGPKAEVAAVVATRRAVEAFRSLYHSIDCAEITGVDMSSGSAAEVVRYFRNNGVRCFRMAAQFAPVAFSQIDVALGEDPGTPPEPPVSCSSEIARRLGGSDMHVVMAAGFAGGVGLSGDACGALAAAVWMLDMDVRRRGTGKAGWGNPEISALIGRFADWSESGLLCSRIAGRTFADVSDHAAYLRAGGCAELLDLLAASA